jgi:hypothetical protein
MFFHRQVEGAPVVDEPDPVGVDENFGALELATQVLPLEPE